MGDAYLIAMWWAMTRSAYITASVLWTMTILRRLGDFMIRRRRTLQGGGGSTVTRRLTIADPVLRVTPTYVHVPTRHDLAIMLAMSGDNSAGIWAKKAEKGKLAYTHAELRGLSPSKGRKWEGSHFVSDLPLTVFLSLLRRGWIEPYCFGMVTVRFQLSTDGRNLIALMRDRG